MCAGFTCEDSPGAFPSKQPPERRGRRPLHGCARGTRAAEGARAKSVVPCGTVALNQARSQARGRRAGALLLAAARAGRRKNSRSGSSCRRRSRRTAPWCRSAGASKSGFASTVAPRQRTRSTSATSVSCCWEFPRSSAVPSEVPRFPRERLLTRADRYSASLPSSSRGCAAPSPGKRRRNCNTSLAPTRCRRQSGPWSCCCTCTWS